LYLDSSAYSIYSSAGLNIVYTLQFEVTLTSDLLTLNLVHVIAVGGVGKFTNVQLKRLA